MLTLADLAGAENNSVNSQGSTSDKINVERSYFDTQLRQYAKDPTKAVFRTGALANTMRPSLPKSPPSEHPTVVHFSHVNEAQSVVACSLPRLEGPVAIMRAHKSC